MWILPITIGRMHPPKPHRALNHSARAPRVVRGYVLLPVVLTMTLVAAIAFLLNTKSPMQVYQVASQRQADQARYITEAGLNHALWQTLHSGCGPYSDNTNLGFANGSYTTTLTTDLGSTNSYTLSVDQDTWIRSDQPTTNKATDTKLHIRYEGGTIERPMYRYDLSSIAANASILSATAWFYVSKEHPEGPVDIHRLTADWTETDATWDTMGANMDSAVLATIPTQPVAGVWVSINLAAQVQAWVNGQANYGITLNSTSEGIHGDYASREAAQQPYLKVIVGTPPSSPATLQSVGTLANGVSRNITRNNVTLYQQPSHHAQQPGTEGTDAEIWDQSPNNNYGDAAETWVSSASNDTTRSLLRFNMGGIPADAKILEATLSLHHQSGFGADQPVSAHRIRNPWSEDSVTWNRRKTGTNWDTAGGDFDNTAVATTPVGPVNQRYEWHITPLVQGWVDGSYPNYGVALIAAIDGMAGERFYTSDHSDPSKRPGLTITYTCTCGSPCLAPQGSGKVLMVVEDPAALLPFDISNKALFESWGYTVDLFDDSSSQSQYDNAVATRDVVFIARSAKSSGMGTKLTDAPIGIVSEKKAMVDELGIASGTSNLVSSDIEVVDTTHYITHIFPTGSLPIYSGGMKLITVTGPAPGLQILAELSGAGALTTLDEGAPLGGGATGQNAAGRRVMLPFISSDDFNPAYVNNNGHLIVQRAIQWASGNLGPVASDPIVLSTSSAASLGGLNFDDIDLAEYDPPGQSATLFFEGALTTLNSDIDALHVMENGHILLSTTDADNLGGLNFADGDLVEYDPATDGATLYFDESLFSADEDITSVYIMDNGHILLSTDSDATLGGLSFTDNDLVEYDPDSDNATLFFDGSTVGLSSDIDAVHLLANGHIVLSTKDDASLGGLSFKDGDLVDYDPATDTATRYFAEASFAADEDLISAHIGPGSGGAPKGPIAHWKLDETSGPTAVDSEGGHDGTLSNGPTWGTGQLDGALDFDGSDDLVDMGSDATLDDIFAGGATVSAWIYPEGWGESDFGRIFDKADNLGSNRNGWAYELYGSNQSILFQYGFSGHIGNWVTPANSISLNTWQHVAVVYDNSSDANDPTLYINGVAQTVTEIDTPSGTPSSDAALNLTLGNYSLDTSRTFDGLLDDVRIYDRMLDAAEIAELANAGNTGPIAHWKLDETSGTTAVDSEGGHDGTLTNGPSWDSGTIDGGLRFDASNDFVDIPHQNSLSLNTFSISAWVRPAALSGWQIVVNKGTTTSAVNYYLATNGDEIGLGFYNAGWVEFNTTNANLSTGQWYHLVGTFDDATREGRVYLDGALVHTSTTTKSPLPNSDALTIGRSGFGEYWAGTLDDIRIYDRVLDPSEITTLAADGGGGGAPLTGCSGTFRDEFNATSFSNNDGTLNWIANWEEVGESDGATSGDVRVTNDQSDYQLRIKDNQNGGEGVAREADLTGAASATLTFDYRRDELDNANDNVQVAVSSAGTGGPWTELGLIAGGGTDSNYQSASYDISAHISATTAIRLRSSTDMGNNDRVYFDNIQIQCIP